MPSTEFEARADAITAGLCHPDHRYDSEQPADDHVTLLTTENGAQLLLSGFGLRVGKTSERILVRHNETICAQVPFFRVQEIIIPSAGVSLTSGLIQECCRRGIRIAFLTPGGQPYAMLSSPYLGAVVETRRRQIQVLAEPAGAAFARAIVAGKIANQRTTLLYFRRSRSGEAASRLRRASGVLRNSMAEALAAGGQNVAAIRQRLLAIEGGAAKAYWEQMRLLLPTSLGFAGRSPKSPQDPVNAALNYAYAILYAQVWSAVVTAGLEPFAGFLHTDRPGKPSLVLDLAEEFRQAVVDIPLFAWLTRGGHLRLSSGLLDGASREAVAGRVLMRLNSAVRHAGAARDLRAVIHAQARRAAAAFRGERPYQPFRFRW